MSFLIGLLTVVLVLDCVVLILLVLIQLPKKEAGAGLAFGGAATDALFGAGSGNMLTKITKYAAGIFFALAILLALVGSRKGSTVSDFEKNLEAQQRAKPVATENALPPSSTPAPPSPAPAVVPPVAPAPTNPAPAK
jgi:preprotein translocase subunit SecG